MPPSGEATGALQAKGQEGPLIRAPTDRFEKSQTPRKQSSGSTLQISRNGGASTDVLRLARTDPNAARQWIATMMAQASTTTQKIQAELAGARGVLEDIAAKKFSKKSLKEKSRELRKKRHAIGAMKMRLLLANRKMSLLQQLAGQLGDPRLDAEIDNLLGNHAQLKTDWGRRYHLLSMSELFYGSGDETPEHLTDVVRANIPMSSEGKDIGDFLPDLSPRRVINELIARTLDGSTSTKETADSLDFDKAPPTLQTWVALRDVMGAALITDPLQPDKKIKSNA